MNVPKLRFDPRLYQIAVLGLLVTFGITVLDFGIHWYNVLAIAAVAQATQCLGTRFAGLASFDPRSALVTTLSLAMLFRTNSFGIAALAAFVAIASKFLVRLNGKHIFNPANVAIVTMMLAFDDAWISTGQWGSATLGALALACLGFLVLTRAQRAETTLAFLAGYAGLLLARTLWLGDPPAIWLHHLENGALLIFAFFMISDPKTSPNGAAGRVAFGTLVAAVAFTIQFVLYQPNGPVIALIVCAPVVPLIDCLQRGTPYRWARDPVAVNPPESKGVFR